jgi:hypothetical protein
MLPRDSVAFYVALLFLLDLTIFLSLALGLLRPKTNDGFLPPKTTTIKSTTYQEDCYFRLKT